MSAALQLQEQIHFKALEISKRYLKSEAELIEVLQQLEQHRVFIQKGYSSLYQYVTHELGLSEGVTYNLITVSRKAKEVPALKTEITNGTITLSNAKRIATVLTLENQKEWLRKASELSCRELDREIVKVKPEAATPEKVSYISASKDGVLGGVFCAQAGRNVSREARVKLELGLSEKEMLRLRRAQDLLSQACRRAVSLEETLITMTREFLTKNDPIEKAKRHVSRKGMIVKSDLIAVKTGSSREELGVNTAKIQSFTRTPIPAGILHQINLRDQRRCTHHTENGLRWRM